MGLLDTSAKGGDPDNHSLLEWEGGRVEGWVMKWPEGQGGGAEVRNDFTITDPRGDRAVKRAKLALLSKRNSIRL